MFNEYRGLAADYRASGLVLRLGPVLRVRGMDDRYRGNQPFIFRVSGGPLQIRNRSNTGAKPPCLMNDRFRAARIGALRPLAEVRTSWNSCSTIDIRSGCGRIIQGLRATEGFGTNAPNRFTMSLRLGVDFHADETPVALLDPDAGKTRRAYVWAYP